MNENRFEVYLIALLAVGIVSGALLRLQAVTSANDASRWNTVWSLNSGKGYVIDEAPYRTIDKVKRDGHFYSSKPALLPTLLAGWTWLLGAVTGMTLPENEGFVIRLTLFLINVVPFGVLIVLYAQLLERLGYGESARLFCVGTAAFGTYLTAYSVTLNNHTLAACAAFFSLYHLIRIQYEHQTHWRHFALCGLFAAWTVANEMVAVVFALILMGWLLRTHPRQTLTFFVPPAAVVAAAYLLTTYLSTGGLLPYYLYFNTPLYQYEGSYWTTPKGIDAANEPKWFYFFNLTFGHHGIFSLSPVFLLAFSGLFMRNRLQGIHRIGLVLSVIMVGFYTFKTNNYGGVCQGARWLFWLIPFWLLSLAPLVDRHITSRVFRVFAFVALLISLTSIGFAISGHKDTRPGPWSASWLQLAMRDAGWIEY